ncbi:chemotaxis protein [Sphingomonas sp. NBWT7]|uniref:methyl-accepting chemotaxis protein n=1 Tax=Sphingomonas sp. NBWT7 TaxID=2596913 RepID=UPI00162A3D88|nr:methyl-accepting chemotaxis protein [Sphingomonas sp. NBWT7]QNE32246.1 chemotaxis protein [Sphingomonas sp. NBWT7]
MSSLDALRVRVIRTLAVIGWLCLPLIAVWGFAMESPNTSLAVFVASLGNIVPTTMAVRGRHDLSARMSFAILAALLPAVYVYLLAGNAWQMDAHMYFFVALSMLAVLCDWRPLALASALIAIHHLLLSYILPQWVFETDGTLGRVLFHALAVILQFAALTYLTTRLRALILAQDFAQGEAEALAATAEAERGRACEALAAAEAAEERSRHERMRREDAEARLERERRQAFDQLADEFEHSVSGVAVAIEQAAATLEDSATTLTRIAADAGRQASEVAAGACQAAGATQDVADAVHRLTGSIGDIAGSAAAQAALTTTVERNAEEGNRAVLDLARRTGDIGGLVGEIHEIAARTNLLALNATIEAARAGDAGRGFAVVAGEVKQLAGGTAQATDKIVALIESVRHGIHVAEANMLGATDAVSRVATAAGDIRGAVSDQRGMAAEIERTAQDAARGVDMIEQRIERVASAVNEADALSRGVREAAVALSDQARQLRQTADGFVDQLRSGERAA